MLSWSVDQKEHPVMIMLPGNKVTSRNADASYDAIHTFKVEQEGEKVAILALGDFYQRGEKLAQKMKETFHIQPTLINPRFASGMDIKLLEQLKENHELMITLEDGILDGGFGQKIASYYGDSNIKVKNYGLQKHFYDRYDPEELLKQEKMDTQSILEYIKSVL